MQYKIGWLARQFGITPQSIRFYEKEGIFSSVLPEEGATRQYYSQNFKWLSGLRRYLLMGFNTREIRAICECDRPQDMAEQMRQKQAEIRREIERLQGNEAMLARSIQMLESIPEHCGTYELVQSPALYILLNQEEDRFLPSREAEERVREWMAYLPFIDAASVVHPDDPDHRFSGFCVTAELAERLELRVDAPVRLYAPRLCARVISGKTQDVPYSFFFEGLGDFLGQNGLHVEGPAFGRCLAKTKEIYCMKNLKPERMYFEYWIPVAKDAAAQSQE